MTENQLLQLDFLYSEAMQLKSHIEINGLFWKVENAKLPNRIKGVCSHNTIFINKSIPNNEKQKILFHELIHAWVITYDPENNNEQNIRNIEEEYYETRLQKWNDTIVP